MLKRAYDLLFAAIGLVLLSPLFLVLALAVKWSDGGPIFYRQQRIGWRGRPFHILKFRTMVVGADKLGPAITKNGDQRITAVGRWLRKTKLDELPQLVNVLRGEMSFVGPRPEVPRYVERYTPGQRRVLELKPGITDLATLEFRNEEDLLRQAEDMEAFYVSHCVPRKIELNLRYAERANVWEDTKIIWRTLLGGNASPDGGGSR
jgi:lipopolysaccharide/colanic/teichoic acid biosynthesis glycosyltransferase